MLAHACIIACSFGDGCGSCDGVGTWDGGDTTCANTFKAKPAVTATVTTKTNIAMMADIAIVLVDFIIADD